MKITLNKADVIEKARAAFLAGELQCQQPGYNPDDGCLYAGPCAIGAALSPDDRLRLDSCGLDMTGIDELVKAELVGVESEGDLKFFVLLQAAHDHGTRGRLAHLLGIE